MKWEDYKKEKTLALSKSNPLEVLSMTNMECPICGNIIYKDVGLVLASNPPQYKYKCLRCGWSDTYY